MSEREVNLFVITVPYFFSVVKYAQDVFTAFNYFSETMVPHCLNI